MVSGCGCIDRCLPGFRMLLADICTPALPILRDHRAAHVADA
jgi:hypothetical protein